MEVIKLIDIEKTYAKGTDAETIALKRLNLQIFKIARLKLIIKCK